MTDIGWKFDNSYARLPELLFDPAPPMKVRAPEVVVLNYELGEQLGLDLRKLSSDEAARLFAGQELPAGAQPIAQAYAGHQFGGFTMLGDGRATLLGEHITPANQRVDIQLKGSGQTPFSRRGDGRAALGPMLREYIISEAMAGLGIPTTRSLAVVLTGEPVFREEILRGAILTRVAASHIRVGTFQYLSAKRDLENLRLFADYTIERHYPELATPANLDSPNKYIEFLKQVIARQAKLIAQWQLVGFIHGVMNTDNMTISGETIDYGPCAFMDQFHPATVFSSIDHDGRYAYGNQPSIGQWNLARFAETLLPLIHTEQDKAIEIAVAALNEYATIFDRHWLNGMRAKIGLQTELEADRELIIGLLNWMQEKEADFTNTFDDLSCGAEREGEFYRDPEFLAWHSSWTERLKKEGSDNAEARTRMQKVNPAIIARNHRVEEALAAANSADLAPLESLVRALKSPFSRNESQSPFRSPPPSNSCRYQTFCGT